MFKFLNPNVEILRARVLDLEKFNENLLGSNNILREELQKSQELVRELQDKLFTIAGFNKSQPESQLVKERQEPIQIGGKTSNWLNTRQSLEQKAQEAYWLKHKEKTEAELAARIKEAESQVLNVNGEEDGSKVN